jgi:exodeoxyribonuclease VII small subunit
MPKASSTSVSSTSSDTVPVSPSYEAAVAELEALVGRLDSGEMPLEQMLSSYQRGAQLLQFCRERLQAVEDQIKVLDDGALKVWKA